MAATSPPGLDRYRLIMNLSLVAQRMPEGMALNEIRIGSRSDLEIRDGVTPMMSAISEDYVRMVSRIAREAGLTTQGFMGMHYNPLTGRYWLAPNTDVNYLVHTVKT